jgi:hypothetical protein
MKAFLVAVLVLLIPAVIAAQPTMGIYFTHTPFNIYYSPTHMGEQFDGYVYGHNIGCYLTACEFSLEIAHPAIQLTGFTLLPGSINLGDPLAGISITYWPPLDGWNPGYNLLCTLHFLAIEFCEEFGGTLVNVPIQIGPHPDTGEIRGTCWPDQNIFQFTGLTSIICPFGTAVEEQSWGAIKSMLD